MNTKYISLVALAQSLTLGFALLCSGTAARAAERFHDFLGGRPLPALTESSLHFRDYGWLCIFLILAWVVSALLSETSSSKRFTAMTSLLGAFLVFGFFLTAIAYIFAVFLPLIPLDSGSLT